jgi:nucleoside-diphosphate-sugar epimerase
MWREETVVIDGGTSFIGAAIARRLAEENAKVHLLIRSDSSVARLPSHLSRITTHRCSSAVDAAAVIKQLDVDLLVHSASMFRAEHQFEEIEPMVAANITYGTLLMDALRGSAKPRVLNLGTSWQHYSGSGYDPVNLYASTKQAFECIIEFYVKANGFQAITAELGDTYGASDHRRKLLPTLVEAVRSGVPLDLSPGEQKLDLLHIDDVVNGLMTSARLLVEGRVSGHQRVALSSGHAVTIREVVDMLSSVLNQPVPVRWGARAYREREVLTPHFAGEAPPGWVPRFSLKDGLEQTYGSADRGGAAHE